MKKKHALAGLEPGSAAYVVAHGNWQRSRGRRCSMAFHSIVDPDVAYAVATEVLRVSAEFRSPLTYDEYHALLDKLPITRPTVRDMIAICPHLEPEQAVKSFLTGSGYVACPPLRIRFGFQIVSFSRGLKKTVRVQVEGGTRTITATKIYPPRLSWSYAGRTIKSYADGRKKGDVFMPYEAMEEAMQYAEKHWNNLLILDTWEDIMTIHVQDPSDLIIRSALNRRGYPKTKMNLYVGFSRGVNVINNDGSRPQSELLDDAIAAITTDPKIYHELKGGRGGFTRFCCAYCGYGLSLTGCGGCGHMFDDDQFRCGGQTPLSRKMVAVLKSCGLEFKKDPEESWQKEAEMFAENETRRLAMEV